MFFSTEDSIIESDLNQSTGGWSWSTSKPSKIKTYGSYSLNWKCSSVIFSTAISNVATTVIIAVLSGTNAGLGLAMGSVSAIVSAFKNSDPYSKGLSYKVYIAKASSPKDNRYCRTKTIYYSRKDYKGTSKSKILYGTML